jgi:hypothetical protein
MRTRAEGLCGHGRKVYADTGGRCGVWYFPLPLLGETPPLLVRRAEGGGSRLCD